MTKFSQNGCIFNMRVYNNIGVLNKMENRSVISLMDGGPKYSENKIKLNIGGRADCLLN